MSICLDESNIHLAVFCSKKTGRKIPGTFLSVRESKILDVRRRKSSWDEVTCMLITCLGGYSRGLVPLGAKCNTYISSHIPTIVHLVLTIFFFSSRVILFLSQSLPFPL